MVIAFHLKNSFKLVRFLEPKSNKSAGSIVLENVSKKQTLKKFFGIRQSFLKMKKKDGFYLFLMRQV